LKKNKKEKDESKSDYLNKSFDYIKINNINNYNSDTVSTLSKRNNNISFYGNDKNIQLEFKKKQFLSKLKREHIVKFKRSHSNSAKKIKNNNSNKNFESELLNNFPWNYNKKATNTVINNHDKDNDYFNIEYNDNNYYNPNSNYSNDIIFNKTKDYIINQKLMSYNNVNSSNYNYSYKNSYREKSDDKGSLNKMLPDKNNGGNSSKSEVINLSSLIIPSQSSKQINSSSKHISGNKENKEKGGYIIKCNNKTINQNNLFKINNNMNEPNKTLTDNEIKRIKKKLESLNYFNLNS
jgi:hypothetical protein